MKLPEDKQERTKVLFLMAIGVGATIYVLVRYAVMPIMKANKKNAKRIGEVTKILEKADMEVQLIGRDRKANEEALARISEISRKNMLHPQMGINYQIPASEVIASIEKKLGFSLQEPVGALSATVPGPSIPKKSDVKTFSMGISLKLPFPKAVKLMRAIREENPYIAIHTISIAAVGSTPEQHSVSFRIDWPIWSNPKKAEEFADPEVDEEQTPAAKKAGDKK